MSEAFANAEREIDVLRALPMRAQKVDVREQESADRARADAPAFKSDVLSIDDASDLFFRNHGIFSRALRSVSADFCGVERCSVNAPPVGHPFLDALLAAHEHGVALSFAPAHIWSLVTRAIAVYLHRYETTVNVLTHCADDFARTPDGVLRLCLSVFRHTEFLDGALNPQLWEVVRDQIVSEVAKMPGSMSTLSVPECAKCRSSYESDCKDPSHTKRTLKLDSKSTKMAPVNLLAKQRPLAPFGDEELQRPQRQQDNLAPGLERLMLQGTLQEWVDLLHALDAIADFPTFADWAKRLLWLVRHFVAHFEMFTRKANRVPISASVEANLQQLRRPMRSAANFVAEFFNAKRDEESGALTLYGSALLLFPHECGFLQISPPCRPQWHPEMVDFEWATAGINASAFTNWMSTFDARIGTPECDVPLRYVSCTIGWVYHQSKRAIEVVDASMILFGVIEKRVPDVSAPSTEKSDEFVAENIEDVLRDRIVIENARNDAVDDMIAMLDKCDGDVDALRRFARDKDCCEYGDKPITEWPNVSPVQVDIERWQERCKQAESDVCETKDDKETTKERTECTDADAEEESAPQDLAQKGAVDDVDSKEKDDGAIEHAGDCDRSRVSGTNDKEERVAVNGEKQKTSGASSASAQNEDKAAQGNPPLSDVERKFAAALHEATVAATEREERQARRLADLERRLANIVTQSKKAAASKSSKAINALQSRLAKSESRVADLESALELQKQGTIASENEIVRLKSRLTEIECASTAPENICVRDFEPSVDAEQGQDDESWSVIGPKAKKAALLVDRTAARPISAAESDDGLAETDEDDDKDYDDDDDEINGAALSSSDLCFLRPCQTPPQTVLLEPLKSPIVEQVALSSAPSNVIWALPFRVVASVAPKDAVRDFASAALHPSLMRACDSLHRCVAHRDEQRAPAMVENFYDRIVHSGERWSLFALLAALADQEMHCGRCQVKVSGVVQSSSPYLLHGGIGAVADIPVAPLPDFVRSLYNALASVEGGSAFRACHVCRREFRDDRYRIALFVRGVAHDGAVCVQIALRCNEPDQQKRCAARLFAHYDAPQCAAPGLTLTVRAYSNLNDDVVVRVHASGDHTVRSPHDLVLHLSGAQPQPMVYEYCTPLHERAKICK